MNMKNALNTLVSGGTFDEFYRKTLPQFTLLANHLLNRWTCPRGVEAGDVVQEMYMTVHKILPKYDPSKGVALERYIIWNSCASAVRWIHTQRNAYRRDDKAPSRFPISESEFFKSKVTDDGCEGLEKFLGAKPPEQEIDVDFATIIEKVTKGSSKKLEVVISLAENYMSKRKTVTHLHTEAHYPLSEAKALVEEVSEEISRYNS